MTKSKILQLAVALSVCAAFAIPTIASAQKKISYEEAFKRCKAFMDKEKGSLGAGTTSVQQGTRRGVHEEVWTLSGSDVRIAMRSRSVRPRRRRSHMRELTVGDRIAAR